MDLHDVCRDAWLEATHIVAAHDMFERIHRVVFGAAEAQFFDVTRTYMHTRLAERSWLKTRLLAVWHRVLERQLVLQLQANNSQSIEH